jgi:signal transduction histidine kinase/CheY-like chemotaxis protein
MLAYRSPIDADSPELDRRVAARSVRLRASQSIHTGPIVGVAATVCGVLFAWMGGGAASLAWAAIVVAAALVNRRACGPLAALPEDAPPAAIAAAEERLWWLTVMNTVTVGAGIWLNAIGSPDAERMFLVTMILSLYSLGALINASTHPPTFVTGAWINMGSMVVFWAARGGEGWAPAVAIFGLLLLLTRFSAQIKRDFVESVRIGRENDALLRRLQDETAAAEAARREAEQANRTKTRFLAAASHDLRQPLHSLMLFSALLERGDAPQRRQFVEHVRAAAGALERQFTALLDLTKLDAGAVDAAPEVVGLRELVRPVVEEARPAAAEKGLALSMDVPEVSLRTDPFLFERILRNLLDNAVKYTERGRIAVTATVQGGEIRLAVADTGCGIPAADHARIFDEFEQLQDRSRTRGRGTGLGLAIVRRLCELLGHRIELVSSPGEGSCFTIVTAVAPEAPVASHAPGIGQAPSTPSEPAVAPTDLEVLVIDDDPDIRVAMDAMLRAWGCRPRVFDALAPLEAALGSWSGDPPAALIADGHLPEGSEGADAIRAVRRRFPGLPAVLVTGDVASGVRAPEGVEVLRKPVSERTLADWLRRAVSAQASR